MRILNVKHKGIDYEFRLLERVQVVEVTKAGRFTYLIKQKASLFVCNCPGAKYHKKCWHVEMVGLVKQMPAINEPWCEWAEEAGVMQYVENERRKVTCGKNGLNGR